MARKSSTKHGVMACVAMLAGMWCVAEPARADIRFTGVNLPSGSFANGDRQGEVYPYAWYYPSQSDVDYFMGKGMNTFRTGFLWDRLQPALHGALNATELQRLDAFVNAATAKGAYVVLDSHDYATYRGIQIGTSGKIGNNTVDVTAESFADFWSRMADHYKNNSRVLFGLTNEPHDMPQMVWVDAATKAVAAIRATGSNNQILVPGNNWTGAWKWLEQDGNKRSNANTLAMINKKTIDGKVVVDPNIIIEVHQYFDQWSSGQSAQIYGDENLGVERIREFTQWCKENQMKAFLGEFAVANSTIGSGNEQIGDELLTKMLTYMKDNGDVWTGWTWWMAGGTWDPNYLFLAEPENPGTPQQKDRPVMSVLTRFSVPEPSTLGLLCAGAWMIAGRGKRP